MTASGQEQFDLRAAIDAALAAADVTSAREHALKFWRNNPNASTARFLLGRIGGLWPDHIVEHRVAILRSFTVEPLTPLLQAEAALAGCRLAVWVGDFNAYGQEILDPTSGLYAHRPDTVILAVQTRDIAPALWSEFATLSDDDVAQEVERAASGLAQLVLKLRGQIAANIVVHGLEPPAHRAEGLLDAQRPIGQAAAIELANARLRAALNGHAGVYVLDYGELQARHGRSRFVNEKKWATARLPLSVEALSWLAQAWWRYVSLFSMPQAKVLALDLDNTLWGGAIGEDGMAGIKLGDEHPGVFHRELQRAVLDIARRGVLVVLLSKNNPEDALQVLDEHPGMLLRREHIAGMRINWEPKANNLISLAEELNLGLESFVVLDDSPFERAAIRAALPQVTVPELGEDPSTYVEVLRNLPSLERLDASAEDLQRNRYYADERQRRTSQDTAESLEGFLASLGVRVQIDPIDPMSIRRAAQLTQKTSQLNMTTRRYSEAQLASQLETPGWAGHVLRSADRFGDNGIVGVAITQARGDFLEVDTLLLSCRVIGRRIEDALLAFLANRARAAGLLRLQGWYLPTAKNAPASGVYRQAGLSCIETRVDAELWEIVLSDKDVETPAWIVVEGTSP